MKLFNILLIALLLINLMLSSQAKGNNEIRIGFVIFLSGEAAIPYGVPARNSAEMLIKVLNCGLDNSNENDTLSFDCTKYPIPGYEKAGIAGVKITPVFLDENGGDVKTRYRNFIEGSSIDVVIGYIVSDNCEKIAELIKEKPKENKTLTVLVNCGTPRIFEGKDKSDYENLFRTGAHSIMDSVALALYVNSHVPDVITIAGINQDYSWGEDSWKYFSGAMYALNKELKEKPLVLYTEKFKGQYDYEVIKLLKSRTDIVHSSFWGSDLEHFIDDGVARGLFDRTQVLLTTGESSMCRLANKIPNGTIIGARGTHGIFAPESYINIWFKKTYSKLYNEWPTDPSYHMALAILGVKKAYEEAYKSTEGWPDPKVVINAFENLEYETPSGLSKMILSNGHQGIQDIAYGKYKYEGGGEIIIENVKYYSAECVNPLTSDSDKWIKFFTEEDYRQCENAKTDKDFLSQPESLSINCCNPKGEEENEELSHNSQFDSKKLPFRYCKE